MSDTSKVSDIYYRATFRHRYVVLMKKAKYRPADGASSKSRYTTGATLKYRYTTPS